MQIQNVAYTTFNGAEMTKIHIRVLSDELEQMNVYKKRPFSWEPERTNYKRRINCRTYQTHMSVGGIERRLKD